MFQEHKAIVAALKNLSEVAQKEGKMEYVDFADELMSHAQSEGKVLYLTAILIGEYMKLELNK